MRMASCTPLFKGSTSSLASNELGPEPTGVTKGTCKVSLRCRVGRESYTDMLKANAIDIWTTHIIEDSDVAKAFLGAQRPLIDVAIVVFMSR